jgi:hypothetical protein
MAKKRTDKHLQVKILIRKLIVSKQALAIPVTFLILFVTMIGMISVTYFFAVDKVNTRSTTLKVATAKQDLLSFSETVLPILWQPGAASVFEFSDTGGKLNVQPVTNHLVIDVSDNQDISATIFNAIVGQIKYELPYSQTADTGTYLKGDSRAITNQSGSIITQLKIVNGAEHPEIHLGYRPTVSYTTAGLDNGKTVNNIRIYIVNLNTSQEFGLRGKIPVKASCINTELSTLNYSIDYTIDTLVFTAAFGGQTSYVTVPISCTQDGAVINIETVESTFQIQRCLR